jgi:hypothetical protein
MSVRSRLLAAAGSVAVALVIVAPAAHAVEQPPPGATVSDGLECHDGAPAWRIGLANSGPDPVIDYTVQVDGGAKADYQVGLGPLLLRYFPAKSGGSHLVVLADGVTYVDDTESITCGTPPTTKPPTTIKPPTTTTVPRTTTTGAPTTTVAPATVPHPMPTAAPTATKADDPVAKVAPATTTRAQTLPFTGGSSLPLALSGSTLVVAGAAVVLGTRRRKP